MFINCWTQEFATSTFCIKELDRLAKTIKKWDNLREVCGYNIQNNHKNWLPREKLVEIDELLFSKRKYNKGRLLPQQRVFGGICAETKECFMYAVPDQTRETFLMDTIIY